MFKLLVQLSVAELFRSRPSYGIDNSARTLTQVERVSMDQDAPTPPVAAVNAVTPTPDSSPSYQTAEDRAAFIKKRAEQRMLERLAALNLKPPPKSGAPLPSDNHGKEQEDRDLKIKQAEERDAKRDQERQRRLADESPAPPPPVKAAVGKKPPPPPSRGSRLSSVGQQSEAHRKEDSEPTKREEARKDRERAIKEQQEAQEERRKQLE